MDVAVIAIALLFFSGVAAYIYMLSTKRVNVPEVALPGKSIQDKKHKTVKQSVAGEIVDFNYSDFESLKHNKSYNRFFAGNLALPTGRVVCTDPMYRELALPQSWSVAPGDYPVYLYFGLHGEFQGAVAYAELLFADEPVAYWELSLIDEKLLGDDLEKSINGNYPVENGLSSFSDYQTFKNFDAGIKEFYSKHPDANYYDTVISPRFEANVNVPPGSGGSDWINFTPPAQKYNIIMFSSGGADGLYPRYVGYGKNGNIVSLVTSFVSAEES